MTTNGQSLSQHRQARLLPFETAERPLVGFVQDYPDGLVTRQLAVSPLLREVILAACAEPLDWDLHGRGRHLTALALDEIARATPLSLGLAMPRDPRLQRVAAALITRPDDPRGLEDFAAMAGASSRRWRGCSARRRASALGSGGSRFG